MKTTAQAAAEYRERRAAKIARMEAGLRAVLAEVEGKSGPVSTRCREIATAALGNATRPVHRVPEVRS